MYIHMYLYIDIYVYICVVICSYISLFTYLCIYLYTCIYIYLYIHVHVCVNEYVYIYIYIHVYTYIILYIYIYDWNYERNKTRSYATSLVDFSISHVYIQNHNRCTISVKPGQRTHTPPAKQMQLLHLLVHYTQNKERINDWGRLAVCTPNLAPRAERTLKSRHS